jgi:hypothetical protein
LKGVEKNRQTDCKNNDINAKSLYYELKLLAREFNPKRRLYAPQEYQAYYPETTEKAVSELESPQQEDQERDCCEGSRRS